MTKKLSLSQRKTSLVLTDAVVAIYALEQSLWELLCHNIPIALTATVLEVAKGKVVRVEAEVSDYEKLIERLPENFIKALDAGELEAIALLFSSLQHKNYHFTTADKLAIKALGILGVSEYGISLEELLEKAGASKSQLKNLPPHFTKKWFKNCLQQGLMERNFSLV